MRLTGVIVAVTDAITAGAAGEIAEQLKERFPGVTFAVLSHGASSVAFEYDDGEIDWRPPSQSTRVESVTEYPGPEEAFEPKYLEPRRKKPWR